jgi:predicted RNase H-like nuclease (RuvC/YqgF family)
MDATAIGTIIGTAIATLAAGGSYFGVVRPMQKKLGGVEEHGGDIEKHGSRIQELESTIKQQTRDLEKLERELNSAQSRLEARNNSIDTRLQQCVTDEEFQAYTASTTQAITGLTEKVGRATGVLETWTRNRS